MAIGHGDLSKKAKRGFAWRYGMPDADFSEWESRLLEEIELLGRRYNQHRLESDSERETKVSSIRERLKEASPETIKTIFYILEGDPGEEE